MASGVTSRACGNDAGDNIGDGDVARAVACGFCIAISAYIAMICESEGVC